MIITAITPQKRRTYRCSVFVDGAFAFGMHNEELARLGITEGAEITRERLNALLAHVVFANARDTALRYLSSRPRSYRDTVKRLEEEAYPESVIARVMALMVKYNYVDDEQFARMYAESRLRTGRYGPRRVRQELRQKGVGADETEQALSHAESCYNETDAAREWLRRMRYDWDETDYARKKKCTDALLRRGFSYAAVKEAMMFEGDEDA